MKIAFLPLLTALCIFTANCTAQETSPLAGLVKKPLPSGQLIKPLPKFSKWRIIYANAKAQGAEKEEENSPSAQPDPSDLGPLREIVVTRTDSVIFSTSIYKSRQTVDQWYVGAIHLVIEPNAPPAPWSSIYEYLPNFRSGDFPDLDWVSESTYIGAKGEGSSEMLVFCQKDSKGLPAYAWINASTRLPVRWQKGEMVRGFQVLQPPTQMLQPPVEVAAVVKEVQQFYRANGVDPNKMN